MSRDTYLALTDYAKYVAEKKPLPATLSDVLKDMKELRHANRLWMASPEATVSEASMSAVWVDRLNGWITSIEHHLAKQHARPD